MRLARPSHPIRLMSVKLNQRGSSLAGSSALLLLCMVFGLAAFATPASAVGTSSASRVPINVIDSEVLQYTEPDSIHPVHEATFIAADLAGLVRTDVVVGVSLNGVSKAYPASILARRGLVNDTVGDTPILVSW